MQAIQKLISIKKVYWNNQFNSYNTHSLTTIHIKLQHVHAQLGFTRGEKMLLVGRDGSGGRGRGRGLTAPHLSVRHNPEHNEAKQEHRRKKRWT